MKTNDEILKEQGIIRWHNFFKKAMEAAQIELFNEISRRCAAGNTIVDVLNEISNEKLNQKP